jgi:heme exporter protein A
VILTGVSRHFGRRRAVTGLTLTMASGDVVGLLGPNGAGKSTLLGMLATLVTPTSGTIEYGALARTLPGEALRGRIGLLAHELHLYPELSARQNLRFFARLHGLNQAAVNAALDAATLVDRADEPVAAFSRGMSQRLALERALMHAPRLALLDEPFTGLDEISAERLAHQLAQLRARGRALVVVTHDPQRAVELSDRALLLHRGRIRASTRRSEGAPFEAAALRESLLRLAREDAAGARA